MITDAATISKIKVLRRSGHSIPEISSVCKISRSTALRYARQVSILPRYQRRWLNRRNASRIMSESQWDIANKNARALLTSLNHSQLAVIGACLYWAEGSKKDFGLSNTDPELIRVFLYVLRHAFSVGDRDLKISLRIYEDLDSRNCMRFWSQVTGIKLGQTTSINVLSGSKNGKLKYGMCRIRVRRGGLLLKNISAIIRRISHVIGPRSSTDRTAQS